MSAVESQHENELDQHELEKYLVLAAAKGDLDEVKRLVKAGADVMGRYIPSLETPIGRGVRIIKLYDNRPRALIERRYSWGLREEEMDVSIIGWTPLQAASAGGHLSTVQFLIESGGDVNDDTEEIGRTALQWAAGTRNLELIQLLLDRGADVNAPPAGFGGMTALQVAAENVCAETVDLLLRSGADANHRPASKLGLTALQAACFRGKLHLVQLLLDRGTRIDGSSSEDSGVTALSAAAGAGHLDIVELLVTKGADVNNEVEDAQDRTALQAAARKGHWNVVEFLLNHDAKVNTDIYRFGGRSPLQSAAEQGNSDMTKLLISRGATVDHQAALENGRTALQAAAEKGNIQMVHLLLSSGANVNMEAGFRNGRTALQAAAEGGNLAIVQLLNDRPRGASVNDTPSRWGGLTSLQAAAGKGHMEIARFLVKKGANPNAETSRLGTTALRVAAGEGHEKMVRWLVSIGADVNGTGPDKKGVTALREAAEHGSLEIVRFLLENGAEVKVTAPSSCYQGTMALQAAAREGHIAIVKLLIKAGASVDGINNYSAQTPLQAAAESGHMDIAKFLVASGADVNAKPMTGHGQAALKGAAEQGHREMVRWLLTEKADIHAKCSGERKTAIEAAVHGGDKEIVQMLVSAGASKSLAFRAAAARGDLHIVKMLHSQGVRADGTVEAEEGDSSTRLTLLQAAAQCGAYSVVRFLQANTADINAPALEDGGRTALQAAAGDGHLQIVKHLLSMKVDVNAPASETNGRTALQAAAEGGHLEVVKYLLSMKADVNAVAADVDGKSALQAALEDDHHKVALLLLNAGAKVHDTLGVDGQSVLHRTCNDETLDLFRALIERCTDDTLNLTNSSGSTALHLAVAQSHRKVINCLLDVPQLNMEIYDIERNTPLKIAIMRDDTITAKLLLNKGARTDGLTPDQVQRVVNMFKDECPEYSKGENDGLHLHFILLCHNRSTGTHLKRTSELGFDIDEWNIYEWETNAKTSILFPSSDSEYNDYKTCSSFVNPDDFLPDTQYPDMAQGESLILWAWSTFSKRYMWSNYTTVHGFRIGVPNSQDIKLNVLLVPYIRFVWPHIFVNAPHLISVYNKTAHSTRIPGNVIFDVTAEATAVSGFTSNEHRIEISWVMAKRNINKGAASPMQAIHFRGNLTRKVPSIPGSAAELVVWCLLDVYDHWIAFLDKAGKQLNKIRDFQLAAEGRDKDVIKSLLMHSREWNKLRETLRKHVEQASDLVKQFKESEVLFGELMVPLRKIPKKEQINKDYNTKTFHGTPLSPTTLLQNDDPVAMGGLGLVGSSLPEPGTLARRATQTITTNSKNTQNVAFSPPTTLRADQAPKTTSVKSLPKIGELERKANQIEKLGERLSRLDRETKEMIELEFNLVSIYEARESVKMSQSMKRLSWITFIFLPLMFVTGLFGMNVDILESNPSWKWYPISAAPFMAFVMLAWLLFKWQPVSKYLKWYKTRDTASFIRNPRRLFGRKRGTLSDEERGEEGKEHND